MLFDNKYCIKINEGYITELSVKKKLKIKEVYEINKQIEKFRNLNREMMGRVIK